ncbi:bll2047 [Bradyrhizobium diazoefficiens USDA 110]|jgi:hypothetical protein|uniref:Bll2047 protein n=3 Tax=Bradyrhizobium TaxID=374 RepID=Q89TF5_BRADU|nr:hypothetical protein RN69_37895 [Bradyrhizobium japonicum]AND87596.1 hypothetical protein AAV28_07075 [Bradyrhizobium diazoefficiens USDA 110]APO50672.1 hypothetical protein BD122_10475 [Bradyrhizobium diazoefficiens]AWL91338.1 hypothetical protein CIT37_02785 [Bradyrhizobium ottawaense]BAL13053.1 hypothetical protein BJ6T_78080 [Bradyrhizobium japonicum USDA 6]
MPQLVISADRWPVMLLIVYSPSLGRAVQRVPIAAPELARSSKWFGISDPDNMAAGGHFATGADKVRIDRRGSLSEALRWRPLPEAARLAQQRTKLSSPNPPPSSSFPHLARRFDRARFGRW